MSYYASRIPKPLRLFSAIIAGITGAWFILFLAKVIPRFFEFESFIYSGEELLIVALAGLVFGYYLSKSLSGLTESCALISAAFIWMLLSAIYNYPPFFYGGISQDYLLAFILLAIFAFSLNLSGALSSSPSAQNIFDTLCSRIAWYIFWLHVGFVYILPIFLRTLSEPIGQNFLYLLILSLGWIAALYLVSVFTTKMAQ